jgi:hypothetical protein
MTFIVNANCELNKELSRTTIPLDRQLPSVSGAGILARNSLGDVTEAESRYNSQFGFVSRVSARMRRKWPRMDCVFHLTSDGWREGSCGKDERLETWKVETEHDDFSRITRWACIWRAGSLDMETRRLLHRRFGSPPVVLVPETDVEIAAANKTAAGSLA